MRPGKQLYAQFARIGKALASPGRLELLDLLAQGEKTVEELASQSGLGVKNASAHLRVLRQARLVEARRSAQWVHYRLAGEGVLRLGGALQAVAREQLAEVEQLSRLYFEGRDGLEPIGTAELRRRLKAGDVTVLDVRPASEYRSGHIPGALSVPARELKRRLAEIPRDRPVVAYCRGPYCVLAVDALEVLRRHGFEGRRYAGGLPGWRASGQRVAAGVASR